MSESREQVAARELAQQIVRTHHCEEPTCWLDVQDTNCLARELARALAACALENLEQGWELAQGRRRYEYDTMRAMLERAAGEKS